MERNTHTGWGVKVGTIYMAFSYGLTALLVFGFQMITVRILKPDQYGSVSVLYSSVVFLSILLGSTFELTLSRYVAEYEASGRNYFILIKRVLLWQACALACFLCISIWQKDVIIQRLFPEVPAFFYILVGCAVCYSFEIGIRGVMRGLREFGIYGAISTSISLFRILFLLLFVVVMQQGLLGAGLSILLAAIANMLVSFFWYKHEWHRINGQQQVEKSQSWENLLRFIPPTMAMFCFSTYFFNTGPIFIKVFGSNEANELAGLFLIATMVTRLPLQLSEAISTNLLPNMSRLSAQGNWRTIQYYFTMSFQLFIPFSLLAIAGMYILGPKIIQFVYPEFSYDRLELTLLMVSTAMIMLVAPLNQFLLAQIKMANVVLSWFVGCVVLTAVVLVAPWNILLRLEIAYLLSSSTIFGLLAIFSYIAISAMRSGEQENQLGSINNA